MKTGNKNQHRVIAGLVLTLLLAAGFASAGVTPPPRDSSLLTMTSEQAVRLSPLHQEMRAILIAEKSELEILYAEFAEATDSRGALAVQRRIAQVKRDSEISLLQVQAEAALAQGRVEDAERLEESIKLLVDPQRGRPTTTPISRSENDGTVRR